MVAACTRPSSLPSPPVCACRLAGGLEDAARRRRMAHRAAPRGRHVNALFGKPGAGKSLITLEIRCSSSAMAAPWSTWTRRTGSSTSSSGCRPSAPNRASSDRLRMYSFAGLPRSTRSRAASTSWPWPSPPRPASSSSTPPPDGAGQGERRGHVPEAVPLLPRPPQSPRDHRAQPRPPRQRREPRATRLLSQRRRRRHDLAPRPGTPATFRLEREKTRSGHGEPAIEIHRRFAPLRHEWDVREEPAEAKLAGQLDSLGIPADAGRPAARKALDAAEIRVSNTQLEAVIRLRKNGYKPNGQANRTAAPGKQPGSERAVS